MREAANRLDCNPRAKRIDLCKSCGGSCSAFSAPITTAARCHQRSLLPHCERRQNFLGAWQLFRHPFAKGHRLYASNKLLVWHTIRSVLAQEYSLELRKQYVQEWPRGLAETLAAQVL